MRPSVIKYLALSFTIKKFSFLSFFYTKTPVPLFWTFKQKTEEQYCRTELLFVFYLMIVQWAVLQCQIENQGKSTRKTLWRKSSFQFFLRYEFLHLFSIINCVKYIGTNCAQLLTICSKYIDNKLTILFLLSKM